MTNLVFLVEGQTEEAIVKGLLVDHLRGYHITSRVEIVVTGPTHAGGGAWRGWRRHMRDLNRRWTAPNTTFTTLIDLYGLPKDLPGRATLLSEPDTNRRTIQAEQIIAREAVDPRWLPYVQRHEVEALVLAALPQLRSMLSEKDQLDGLAALTRDIAGKLPEDVNDGEHTAPSKRLLKRIPKYVKTLHGPNTLRIADLAQVRAACPRFNAWVSRLESLGAP
ncbi:DUF4276 family protein [Myxococcota bacterium]|nr:DUF4276 family protein [Myxococcota bacterium]